MEHNVGIQIVMMWGEDLLKRYDTKKGREGKGGTSSPSRVTIYWSIDGMRWEETERDESLYLIYSSLHSWINGSERWKKGRGQRETSWMIGMKQEEMQMRYSEILTQSQTWSLFRVSRAIHRMTMSTRKKFLRWKIPLTLIFIRYSSVNMNLV